MAERIHTAGPVHLAAIDAGSNAIRIAIARAESPYLLRTLHTERYPVRLGHNVFTNRTLDKKAVARAIKGLRRFAALMAKHHVPLDKDHYRAVATSATREARNRRQFVRRVKRKADIQLEIIDGAEEARLVVGAVLDALGSRLSPRLVVDLGGGSLEVNLIRQGQVEFSRALPVGTVRLLESFDVERSRGMTSDEHIAVRNFVVSVLRASFRRPPELSGELAVACGGNAEALAQVAPGPPVRGIPTINVRLLRERLWDVLGRDVRRRMKAFGVREDRADVMGIAAIVFLTLARWMNIRTFLVPGVGVREGVLRVLVQQHFAEEITAAEEKKAKAVLAAVRWFAAKHQSNARHDEQVRRLVLSLFDQLAPVHHMGAAERRLLEWGALLHDIGHFINNKQHARHGEYLVRNGQIAGLKGWRRDVVACLVRYHNQKSEPDLDHKLYASLDPVRRRHVRGLAALLRIAEGLDNDHKQSAVDVEAVRDGRAIELLVHLRNPAPKLIAAAQRKVKLLEREFGVRVEVRRLAAPRRASPAKRRVA